MIWQYLAGQYNSSGRKKLKSHCVAIPSRVEKNRSNSQDEEGNPPPRWNLHASPALDIIPPSPPSPAIKPHLLGLPPPSSWTINQFPPPSISLPLRLLIRYCKTGERMRYRRRYLLFPISDRKKSQIIPRVTENGNNGSSFFLSLRSGSTHRAGGGGGSALKSPPHPSPQQQ